MHARWRAGASAIARHLAAGDRRDMLDDVARFDLRRQVRRHRDQQRHLALAQVGADRLRVP